ncbi:MAG: hypothetical protein KatS3mg057_2390 [Herpetosiphonaceae bacterium]|nr:MAG: hypothetical protein KatS3mg057_2390 [Herpetosiphonaceae bacterium]
MMSGQHSAERIHKRGDIEQPDEGMEREIPEKTEGGPMPRGQHPIEPAEGARRPGEEAGGTQGKHPIEPAEGSRENVSE